MLEKTEGVIKSEQSRETGSIGHNWHRTKINKTQQNKNDEQQALHQNHGVNGKRFLPLIWHPLIVCYDQPIIFNFKWITHIN